MGELFIDLIETLYDVDLRSVIHLYMIDRPYDLYDITLNARSAHLKYKANHFSFRKSSPVYMFFYEKLGVKHYKIRISHNGL